MPRLIVTAGAGRGLERCRRFLSGKNMRAAVPAGTVIEQHLALLEASPEIGRPHSDLAEMRELVIGFGDASYVALYRYAPEQDTVLVVAFRHQKEA